MSGLIRGDRNAFERLLSKLQSAGGKLPRAVTDAAATCERIDAEAAAIGTTDTRRHKVVTALLDHQKVSPAEWAAVADVDERHTIYRLAKERATTEYVQIARANGDQILQQANDRWFAPAVEKLQETASATTSDDTPETLIRSGKHDAAALLAMAPKDLATIRVAYELQRRLFAMSSTALASWANPDVAAAGSTQVAPFLAALRAGGQPWLPTLDQLEEARSQRKLDAQRAQAAKPRLPGHRMSMGM